MTERELLGHLRRAVECAAPDDLEGVLSRCREQSVRGGTEEKKPRRFRAAPWLAAACLVLVLVLTGGGLHLRQLNAVACAVSLDVNPSLELRLNARSRVVSAAALNEDAAAILEGMDLKGAHVNVAVNALVGSLLQHGYVDELANSILVTVEDSDSTRGAALQQELTAEIEGILSAASVNAAILSQTVTEDGALQARADEYGISLGKATLIQSLVDGSDHLTFEALAGLTVNELNLLASNPRIPLPDTVASTGSASDGAYIGAEAAKAAAFARAGVSAGQARELEVDFDYEDGRLVYEVEFTVGGVEYDCDVDASTGAVVKYKAEGGEAEGSAQTGAPAGQASSQAVGAEAAQAAALRHAGLSASVVTGLRVKEDWDDGTLEYEVKFQKDGVEYDYEIDGFTGRVLKAEQDRDDSEDREDWDDQDDREDREDGTPVSGAAGDIGEAAAREAALRHAGVSASAAQDVSADRESDGGAVCYEVEFQADGLEYAYKIDAATGRVFSWESEQDD